MQQSGADVVAVEYIASASAAATVASCCYHSVTLDYAVPAASDSIVETWSFLPPSSWPFDGDIMHLHRHDKNHSFSPSAVFATSSLYCDARYRRALHYTTDPAGADARSSVSFMIVHCLQSPWL